MFRPQGKERIPMARKTEFFLVNFDEDRHSTDDLQNLDL